MKKTFSKNQKAAALFALAALLATSPAFAADSNSQAPATAPQSSPMLSSESHPQGAWTKNQTLKISWDPVEGAERYMYVLDFNEGTDPSAGTKTGQTSVILNSVKDGERYFHAAACNGFGCGPASHYLALVDTTPPSPVTGLAGTPGLGGIITLKWDGQKDLSGIVEYQIFRSTYQRTSNNRDFLPTDPGVAKYTTKETSFKDSEWLRAGAPYYYRVLAVDGAGNVGAPSGVKTVRNVHEGPAPQPSQSPQSSATPADNGQATAPPQQNPPVQGEPVAEEDGTASPAAPEQKFPNPLTDKSYAAPIGLPAPSAPPLGGSANEMSPSAAIVVALLVIAGAIAAFSMMPKGKGGPEKKGGHHRWASPQGHAQNTQKGASKGKK